MFLQSVQQQIMSRELMPAGGGVLVGVSGGMDSTVLLDALCKLGFAVEVAHINFALRGEDSQMDEHFVRSLCRDHGLPCHVKHMDAASHAHQFRMSVQMAARDLRYEVFAEYAKLLRLEFVAVGHHANDQAETVLLNLLRGSGPEGLAGMPIVRALGSATLVRPLLNQSRTAIAKYAHGAGLSWREDTSNTDPKYLRGALRQRLWPALKEVAGPGVGSRIAYSADLMREYVDAALLPTLRETFKRAAGERQLHLDVLTDLPPVWQRRVVLEALRCWLPGAPASIVDHVMSLVSSQPGRRVTCGAGAVWRGRESLLFEHHPAPRTNEAVALHAGKCVAIDGGRVEITVSDQYPQNLEEESPKVAYVDGDRLEFPLMVRRWQAGDRMVPLGMAHTKKVSDVLTDAKVRVDMRTRAHVVCSGKDIVWLVGVRLSDLFRVRKGTLRFARFALL